MDPLDLRASVPALADTTYLNYGASGPPSEAVLEAARDAITDHSAAHAGEGPYDYAFDTFDRARAAAADLLGTESECVALTNSTADAITRVADALDLGAGDVVVRSDLEHPANVLPWARLAETRGVEVRVLETRAGRIDRDAYSDAVRDADLVTLQSLTWSHGTRWPIAALVDEAHDAGARVLVDAVQSVGHHPVDVAAWGADAVAAASHKWLLGPWGAGMLAVAPDALDALEPDRVGYRSVERGEGLTFHADARRFELGTASPAPYAGLVAAVETAQAVGVDRVADRIHRLAGRLTDRIPADRLVSPADPESGLVTIDVDDPEATVERLDAADIRIRSLPTPEGTVRASIHAVSTAEEVDRVATALIE
ncbi:aminotransferase class V-fold PLP-dependent enzyme [Halococcoides cellulosivorans]|uniref:Cysteine desulfurase n=1 Tax=Halococcoides cellulosivorans TaxID=1679096 RepID=A0A2R4X2T5_9EURY|nr:aminotransferase class V-fold PLP-dependent enzyme [Halococcoides cellulosivorans]AWB28023.1 cysteine desulfurase [Halococcoides cellulosivorans]